MQFTREVNRLMLGMLTLFLLVTISSAYWALTGPETITARGDNPRLVVAEAAIIRGSIYDRDGVLLAQSLLASDGIAQRQYPYEATSSAIGYYSFRYGVAGIEAAFDSILRGDLAVNDLNTSFERDVLHRPQEGVDIRLTLDLALQKQVVQLMNGRQGAAVVVSIPDGEILALVSLPSYDPNLLDANWEQYINMPGDLFFNRVLQGQYQPGGILQTALMTAAILAEEPLDSIIENATMPVPVQEVTVRCATQPPQSDLTLTQAYAHACPNPFEKLITQFNEPILMNILANFRLDESVDLFDITAPENEVSIVAAPPPDNSQEILRDNLLGQGTLTVNPLSIATFTTAIVNEGNAAQPFILSGIRDLDNDWITQQSEQVTLPMMTAEAARTIRELMVSNVMGGAAAQSELTIGGHTALAYSGDETQAWYIGFITTDTNQAAVLALVLENTPNVEVSASTGGNILRATFEHILADSD